MIELSVKLVSLSAALLSPAIFLLYFTTATKTDKRDDLVWQGIGLGASTSIAAAVFSGFLDPMFNFEGSYLETKAISAFVVVALPEEAMKLVALLCIGKAGLRDEKPSMYVLLGISVSLGFAAFENVFYVLQSEQWDGTALIRAYTAVPGHAFTGALMGWCFFWALNSKERAFWMFTAYCAPAFFHGAYDFPLMSLNIYEIGYENLSDKIQKWLVLGFALIVIIEGIIAHLCVQHSLKLAERIERTRENTVQTALSYKTGVVGWGVLALFCWLYASLTYLKPDFFTQVISINSVYSESWFSKVLVLFVFLHGVAFSGMAWAIYRQKHSSLEPELQKDK